MEWEDFGIKGESEKDYVLKVMPSIQKRYGNSETMERKNGKKLENWKRKAEKQSRREENWECDIWQKNTSEITGHEFEIRDDRRTGKNTGN